MQSHTITLCRSTRKTKVIVNLKDYATDNTDTGDTVLMVFYFFIIVFPIVSIVFMAHLLVYKVSPLIAILLVLKSGDWWMHRQTY